MPACLIRIKTTRMLQSYWTAFKGNLGNETRQNANKWEITGKKEYSLKDGNTQDRIETGDETAISTKRRLREMKECKGIVWGKTTVAFGG